MRSFHKIFFAFTILSYTSCAEETSTTNIPLTDTDSLITQKMDTTPGADSLSVIVSTPKDTIPAVLLNWEKELQAKGITMSLAKFYAAGMNEFFLYDQGEWDGVVRNSYVSSPDNHYYSYEVSSWNDGDADTYVHLIDRQLKKQYIVNVIGTCCSYAGTGWLDDHTLIAIGYDTYQAEERYPRQYLTQGFYSVFDLSTNTMTMYESRNFFKRPCKCGPSSSE